MAKLIDYKCRYAEYTGISGEVAASEGLTLPEAYMNASSLAKLAQAMEKEKTGYCVLPVDPVLEAENMGVSVKFDDSPLGPRKADNIEVSVINYLKLND